jgi:general secretion pathway protein G
MQMPSPYQFRDHLSKPVKTNLKSVRNERGMTLIEIMIVIAIIAGLLAVLGTMAFARLKEARVSTAKIQMKSIGQALESYNLACNSYPTTDQGLEALITKPSADACANWGPEQYLKKSQKVDPWKKEFIYESDGSTFELKSLGEDKKEGGEGNAKDILFSELE